MRSIATLLILLSPAAMSAQPLRTPPAVFNVDRLNDLRSTTSVEVHPTYWRGLVHAVASSVSTASREAASLGAPGRGAGSQYSPTPAPADVLTPNTRKNTPYLKIAARGSVTLAAYSNDRWLDNTQLDVGRTSGESDIYSNAAGFGFGGGAEIEYPINTGLSVVGSAEFVRANFGKQGVVDQECVSSDGKVSVTRASHDWDAHLDYIKIGAVAKLVFPSFYIIGGFTGSRLLSSTVNRRREMADAACTYPRSGLNPDFESAELPDAAGIHFALRTGFGLVYPIAEGLQFSPELTLDFGYGSINKSPESDLDIYSVSAVLRYELR